MHSPLRFPYPGLRSFRRDESDLFFGRDACIERMAERLAPTRFLAVLGASGGGKSSLVRTGLLDALNLGILPQAGCRWTVATLQPGDRPMANLAQALLTATAPADRPPDATAFDLLTSYLRRGPRSVVDWCGDGALPVGSTLLILVDQFEELFRYANYAGREEAEAFVGLLLESARTVEIPIYVVMTMRSEFLGACALIPGLVEAINAGLYLTPRMTRREIQEAIEGPATVCGFTIEPALVTRLLNDLSGFASWEDDKSVDQLQRLSRRADQLPLMQHVLNRLWSRASAGDPDRPVEPKGIELRLEDYAQLGGIGGALDAQAKEICNALGPTDQPLIKTVFCALVSGETTATAVRRPCRFGELVALADGNREAVTRIVNAFRARDCHFLTPAGDGVLRDDEVIDIGHESLIRQWSSVSDWIRDESKSAATYRFIEGNAQRLWDGKNENLLRMPHLRDALDWRKREHPNAEWAKRYGGDFDRAMKYLNRSRFIERFGLIITTIGSILLIVFGAFCWNYLVQKSPQLAERKQAIILSRELLNIDSQPDSSTADNGSGTPLTIPGATVVTTRYLFKLMLDHSDIILIDARSHDNYVTIRGAIPIADIGQTVSPWDWAEHHLKLRLDNLSGQNPLAPVVFFGDGINSWDSYNAARRAVHAGYQHVYWYRGGWNSWSLWALWIKPEITDIRNVSSLKQFAFLPLLRSPTEQTDNLISLISESITAQRRWALVMSLAETLSEVMITIKQPEYLNNMIDVADFVKNQFVAMEKELPNNIPFLIDASSSTAELSHAFNGNDNEYANDFRSLAEAFFSLLIAEKNTAAPDDFKNLYPDLANLSHKFILIRSDPMALEAADAAMSVAPATDIWIQAKRAHALLFLGRTEEARAIYTRFRGQRSGLKDELWETTVTKDFADLRNNGRSHPLMEEIEKEFMTPNQP